MTTLATPYGSDLVQVGGAFMTSPQMAARAEQVGMPAGGLYFRGRVAPVGAIDAARATELLAIFPNWVIDATWTGSAALPPQAATAMYGAALVAWGGDTLAGLGPCAGELAFLGSVVVEAAAGPAAAAIYRAWRSVPWPEGEFAQAAWALMLLRELRGAHHFAALATQGLDVPLAVLGDPNGGVARLLRTAWREPEVGALLARAAATPDLTERWQAAERATDQALGADLEVLTPDDRERLANLISAAADLARAVEKVDMAQPAA